MRELGMRFGTISGLDIRIRVIVGCLRCIPRYNRILKYWTFLLIFFIELREAFLFFCIDDCKSLTRFIRFTLTYYIIIINFTLLYVTLYADYNTKHILLKRITLIPVVYNCMLHILRYSIIILNATIFGSFSIMAIMFMEASTFICLSSLISSFWFSFEIEHSHKMCSM